jgi:hypothetical protein
MTVTIGFFDNEEGALDAAKKLKEGSTKANGVRLLVQNADSAPILTAQTDIPVEEVYAIRDERGYGGIDIVPLGAAAFTPTGGYNGANGATGNGTPGVVVGGLGSEEGPGTKEVLQDIGIPDHHADSCKDAINNGQYLLVADGDLGIETEDWLRQAGAWQTLQ